jgi:hypothetical protein
MSSRESHDSGGQSAGEPKAAKGFGGQLIRKSGQFEEFFPGGRRQDLGSSELPRKSRNNSIEQQGRYGSFSSSTPTTDLRQSLQLNSSSEKVPPPPSEKMEATVPPRSQGQPEIHTLSKSTAQESTSIQVFDPRSGGSPNRPPNLNQPLQQQQQYQVMQPNSTVIRKLVALRIQLRTRRFPAPPTPF